MNKYKQLSDNELIEQIRLGDSPAQDALLERYRNTAKKIARTFFIMGADFEDIVQEGMLGLFKAIRNYDSKKGASFETYASVCITRQIINAIKSASRRKHAPLNYYISLDFVPGAMDENVSGMIGESPETLLIIREEGKKIVNDIYTHLSAYETGVLDLYLEGKSYQEIAQILGKPLKSIDNTIQRIRRKTEKFIGE